MKNIKIITSILLFSFQIINAQITKEDVIKDLINEIKWNSESNYFQQGYISEFTGVEKINCYSIVVGYKLYIGEGKIVVGNFKMPTGDIKVNYIYGDENSGKDGYRFTLISGKSMPNEFSLKGDSKKIQNRSLSVDGFLINKAAVMRINELLNKLRKLCNLN